MKKLEFFKSRDVRSPERATDKAAGIDFFIPNDAYQYVVEFPPSGKGPAVLHPGQRITIPSGIYAKLPKNYALIAMNRSGISFKKGLTVGANVIDEDYQGEIHLHVTNTGDDLAEIEIGEKLVQMLLVPVEYPKLEELSSLEDLYEEKTKRGSKGFGSSDKNQF